MTNTELENILKENVTIGELVAGHNYVICIPKTSMLERQVRNLITILKDKMKVSAVIVLVDNIRIFDITEPRL
jgi:hypothetical protein